MPSVCRNGARRSSASRATSRPRRESRWWGCARRRPRRPGGRGQGSSSNDGGDVTGVVPAGLFTFPASVPGIGYHEWKAAVTPVSSISHKGQLAGAKVLAASIIDLLTSPELLRNARAEFEV